MVPDGGGTRGSGQVIRVEGRMKFGGQLSLREISRPDLFLQVFRSVICVLSGGDSIISGDHQILAYTFIS